MPRARRESGISIPFLAAWDVCNINGQGKIRARLFFAIVSRNPTDVGDVGECDVARRLRGDLASGHEATERQRARRVRGSAQGRENVLHPPCAFLVRPALMTHDDARERACVYGSKTRVNPLIAGYGRAICRNASPTAMAAAIATLSERRPSRIGMTRRASAALCT